MKIPVAKYVVEGMGLHIPHRARARSNGEGNWLSGVLHNTDARIREKRGIPKLITTELLWTLDMKLLQHPFFHNILTESPFFANLLVPEDTR